MSYHSSQKKYYKKSGRKGPPKTPAFNPFKDAINKYKTDFRQQVRDMFSRFRSHPYPLDIRKGKKPFGSTYDKQRNPDYRPSPSNQKSDLLQQSKTSTQKIDPFDPEIIPDTEMHEEDIEIIELEPEPVEVDPQLKLTEFITPDVEDKMVSNEMKDDFITDIDSENGPVELQLDLQDAEILLELDQPQTELQLQDLEFLNSPDVEHGTSISLECAVENEIKKNQDLESRIEASDDMNVETEIKMLETDNLDGPMCLVLNHMGKAQNSYFNQRILINYE